VCAQRAAGEGLLARRPLRPIIPSERDSSSKFIHVYQCANMPQVARSTPRFALGPSCPGAFLFEQGPLQRVPHASSFSLGGFSCLQQQLAPPQPQQQRAQWPPPLVPRPPLFFARLFGGGPSASGGGGGGGGEQDARFLRWLEALAAEEAAKDDAARAAAAEPRVRHESGWYQERCAFCAACKAAIDATVAKRGVRCAGCRRWFHARCCAALGGAGAAGTAGCSAPGQFFHTPQCEEAYCRLRREAAKGRRALAHQPQGWMQGLLGGLLGGGRGGAGAEVPEGERMTVRLIDLAEAKQQVCGGLPVRQGWWGGAAGGAGLPQPAAHMYDWVGGGLMGQAPA
jgi:hypothetical protein